MNGYSTGWRFNGWFNGTAPTALTGDGVFTNPVNSLVTLAPSNSWQGNITNEPQALSAISVHGYNAIRLRFPMSTLDALGGALIYPVTWGVWVIDSDVEPDQTPSIWMASLYATVLTSWPTTTVVPTVSSTTHTDYFNIYGKTWIRLANAVRIVQGQSAVGDLREIPATSPTSTNAAYSHIGNTYAGALGSYSSLQPHSITAAGANVADIYSDASICPTYSPALGTINASSAGEMYINNLAGSQYLLCLPIAGWGYQSASVKYTAPSATITGKAKSVGVMYNLLQ